jgi:hypothetical protein
MVSQSNCRPPAPIFDTGRQTSKPKLSPAFESVPSQLTYYRQSVPLTIRHPRDRSQQIGVRKSRRLVAFDSSHPGHLHAESELNSPEVHNPHSHPAGRRSHPRSNRIISLQNYYVRSIASPAHLRPLIAPSALRTQTVRQRPKTPQKSACGKLVKGYACGKTAKPYKTKRKYFSGN